MPALWRNAARSRICKARSSNWCSACVASNNCAERRNTWRAWGQSSTSNPPLKQSSSDVGSERCHQTNSSVENSFVMCNPPLHFDGFHLSRVHYIQNLAPEVPRLQHVPVLAKRGVLLFA